MVQLSANNETFELLNGSSIKITKQIADIFNISEVSASYTNGFKIPKTPHNTRIMENLGIVGDQSGIPYRKVPSTLSKDGFSIFPQGWLSVSQTDDDYDVKVLDGIVDFFKAIENKTMGVDLDLSDFNHTKDLDSVIASFSNAFYTYIIADYNGKKEGNIGSGAGINIDYLVPGFNMGKLLELVMTTFGFTYDPTNITELNELYITYPNEIVNIDGDELIGDFYKEFFAATPTQVSPGSEIYHVPQEYDWTSATITEGTVIANWSFVLPESTGYKLTISTEMYSLYKRFGGAEYYNPVLVRVDVNGFPVISFNSDHEAAVEGEASFYGTQGDVVDIKWFASPYLIGGFSLRQIRHNSTYFKVYKTDSGSANLSDAFKDFQIKDFIKECVWRTATTPVIDTVNKHVSFVNLDYRLDYANAEDWSDKYVRRKNETYTHSYAQRNVFKHKYNNPDDVSQDGYLLIDNQNIDDEKIIVNSKIYAPENINSNILNLTTKVYPIWQPEPKEDEDGNMTIEYKGLTNRFYILKKQLSPTGSYRLVSEAIIGSEIVAQVPYAVADGTTFSQIVPAKYDKYNWVFNRFKTHYIELVLTITDILTLDLTRPKYFRQEGAYYILNKVTFDEGKISTGEFVRINKL